MKIVETPQIENGVLQRGARNHQPMLGPNRFHRARILGLTVFDVLCFVQNHGVKLDVSVFSDVTSQQRITGHHEICRGDPVKSTLPTRATENQNAEVRHKSSRLCHPVEDQRRWAHDELRLPAG